jgi:hypothetical protein
MAILRLSIFTPQPGNEKRVANLLEALDTAFAQQSGYVLGLRFTGTGGDGEMGRIFVWESDQAGQRAEESPEASSLVRRLQQLSQPDPMERSFHLQGYALRPS